MMYLVNILWQLTWLTFFVTQRCVRWEPLCYITSCFHGNPRGGRAFDSNPPAPADFFSLPLSTPRLRRIHKSVSDRRNTAELAGRAVVLWASVVKFPSNGRFAFLTQRAGILHLKPGNFFLWIGTLWRSADCNMSFFSRRFVQSCFLQPLGAERHSAAGNSA